MAGLFQVLWGQKDGSFKREQPLNGTDDQPLVIPAGKDDVTDAICTRPTATDWDGDGDLDLVVGNFKGTFFVFTGEGKGAFQPPPQSRADPPGRPARQEYSLKMFRLFRVQAHDGDVGAGGAQKPGGLADNA